jgi:uncharacterized protein YjbI with pentapeptide repeats
MFDKFNLDKWKTETDFSDQSYNNLDFDKLIIEEKSFENCLFQSCSLIETAFKHCTFVDCDFKNCNLSLVKFDFSSHTNTTFEDSKLVGINWTKVNRILDLSFQNCIINNSTFMGLNLRDMKLIKCIAQDVNFGQANLTEAKCNYTDFKKSEFLKTNLTKTDFTNATNYAINPNDNLLKKTIFSLPEAMSLLNGFDIVLK